jgi:hypothetical protein
VLSKLLTSMTSMRGRMERRERVGPDLARRIRPGEPVLNRPDPDAKSMMRAFLVEKRSATEK